MKYSLILASALAMAAGMSGAQTAAPGTAETTVPAPDTCGATGSICPDATRAGTDQPVAGGTTGADSGGGQDSDDDDHGDD